MTQTQTATPPNHSALRHGIEAAVRAARDYTKPRLDARRQQHLARIWLDYRDRLWLDAYTAWFLDGGWEQGADTPDVAYAKAQAARLARYRRQT